MSANVVGCVAADNSQTPAVREKTEQLRIALVFDRAMGRDWLPELIGQINDSASAIVGPVAIFGSRAEESRPSEPWLLRLWCALDRFLFASRTKQSEGRLVNHRLGFVSRAGEAEVLASATMEALEHSHVDLIVQIGGSASIPELARLAANGLWWIPQSGSSTGGASWFRIVLERSNVFETVLKAYAPDTHECRVGARNFAAVDELSLFRYQAAKQRKIAELVVSELEQLQRLKTGYRESRRDTEAEARTEQHPEPVLHPSSIDAAKFLLRWVCRGTVRRVSRWFWREHWFVAYRPNIGVLPGSVDGMQDFKILPSRKDRFYADPFAIDRAGKSYLFFEDYPFDKGKGLISFVEIDSSGQYSEPEIALEREYHLSYPHIFEHEGEIYMVPESLEPRRIDLYRAVEFPRKWTLAKTLIKDIAAVDPTIFFHNGKVWLFASGIRSEHCINEELFLFFSDSLWGEWTSHPSNPIVSDVRRARPAGSLFVHRGSILRPAQDCSEVYGRTVRFHRVEELSETAYREVPISIIGPEWRAGNQGTHTFNQTATMQTIDGRILVRRYRLGTPFRSRQKRLEAAPGIGRPTASELPAAPILVPAASPCHALTIDQQDERCMDGLIR